MKEYQMPKMPAELENKWQTLKNVQDDLAQKPTQTENPLAKDLYPERSSLSFEELFQKLR